MIYNRSFTWLQWTPTSDATYGQEKPGWTSGQVLWGNLMIQSANKATVYDAEEETEHAVIVLRQFPHLNPLDRLIDRQFSETWVVDGVHRNFDTNATMVTVHKFYQQSGT